jgi:cell division protein ZapA
MRLKRRSSKKKNEFKDLSNKFKELKSLIYEYRDKKEDEIKKLNLNHEDFKIEIENNQKKYEQLIDEAADQISNFVKKAKIDNLSQ